MERSELQKRLESLAEGFIKSKLWEVLTDSDVFAVQLESGETAYCCVMGESGFHRGLGVYVGSQGFRAYLDSIDKSRLNNHKLMFDRIGYHSDIQMAVSDEGKPDFWCMRPHLVPEADNYTDHERDIMCQALQACISLRTFLAVAGDDVVSFGFDEYEEYPEKEGGKEVPLLTHKDDGYICTTTTLPAYDRSPEAWVSSLAEKAMEDNGVLRALNRLNSLRKVGTLQCRLVHAPTSVRGENGAPAYTPHVLLAVKQSDGRVLKPEMARLDEDGGAETILTNFCDSLLDEERMPLQISVPDMMTEGFLKPLSKQLHIKIVRERRPLRELNEMWESLYHHFTSDSEDTDDDSYEHFVPPFGAFGLA